MKLTAAFECYASRLFSVEADKAKFINHGQITDRARAASVCELGSKFANMVVQLQVPMGL